MRNTKATGVVAGVCAAVLPAAAGRAQAVWTGAAGNNSWHTGGNWSTGFEPGATQTATVPAGFPTITALGITAQSISAMSRLTVGGAAIQISQASSIKDATITGGFVAGGLATFTGDVTVQAANSWIGAGGFRNTGVFTSLSTPMSSTTFTNAGTLRVPGVFTVGGASALLINNGTLELQNAGSLMSGGLVTNNATFRKTGAGTSDIQCRVDQHGGSLDVQAGTLRMTGGTLFYDGAVSVAAGATLKLDVPSLIPYTFAGVPQFGGAGDVVLQVAMASPARVVADQPFACTGPLGLHLASGAVLIESLGTLRNSGKVAWGAFTVQGPGEMVNEAGSTVTLLASTSPAMSLNAVLRNGGTIEVGANLTFNDAMLVNLPGGTINLRGFGTATTTAIHGTLENRGTVRRTSGGPGSCEIRTRFDQNGGGVTRVESDVLVLLGGGIWGPGGGTFDLTGSGGLNPWLRVTAGTYTISSPGHEILGSDRYPLAQIENPNTIVEVQPGGTLLLDVSDEFFPNAGVWLLSNANLGGAGRILNRGVFYWNGRVGVNGLADFHNGAGAQAYIRQPGSGTLRGTFTNEQDGQMEESTNLDMANATVLNEGDWLLAPGLAPLLILGAGGEFRNTGLLKVSDAGSGHHASISTALNNPGTVWAARGTLNITGPVAQIQNGVLTGGTWQIDPGGRILFPAGSFTRIAGAVITGSQAGIPQLGGLTEVGGGRVTATDDISVGGSLVIRNGGVLLIGPGADFTAPGGAQVGDPNFLSSFVDQKTVLSLQPDPPRLITPTLTVHGTIRPGGPDSAGPFNLVGNLSMQTGGTVEVELGGMVPEDEHDRVSITGTAALAGVLDLKLLPGFTPQLGQVFAVLACTGATTGTFATVRQPASMPAGRTLEASYTGSAVLVTVVAGCYANCDGSTIPPVLNVLDFTCFLNRFAAQDPAANCDGSTTPPVLNVLDFGCFLNRFAQGCV